MKRIEKNQLVGTEMGWAVFRDLFEDSNGKRVSVHTSHEFWIADEKKPGEVMPSRATLFARHTLGGSDGVILRTEWERRQTNAT